MYYGKSKIEHIIIPSVGYQSHLCLDLLLVDCRTHVTVGDEMVCGTDGVTYANHCKFVHAACQYENLHVHNHGACPPGFSTTTIAPGGSMATGSQSGSGTTAPSSAYIQSMFCRNKEFIGCPATFNIVCGSNGLFYPNSCELSKAVCDAPSLVEVPCSQSQSTQPPLPTTTTPARTTTHAGPIPIIG